DPETLPLAVSPDGRVEDAEARGGAVEEDVAACLRTHEPVADAGELHRLTVRQHDETDTECGRRAGARREHPPRPLPPLGAPPECVEVERRREVGNPPRRDG